MEIVEDKDDYPSNAQTEDAIDIVFTPEDSGDHNSSNFSMNVQALPELELTKAMNYDTRDMGKASDRRFTSFLPRVIAQVLSSSNVVETTTHR